MMGADEGYVFSDRRLGGADVLATSYTLSQAIQSVGDFDLILCGKQTTDGDTAQVGAELAEYLGIPNVSMLYSKASVVNSLMGKIAAKCKIQPTPATQEPTGRSVDSLKADLNAIKNYI